MAEFAQLVLAVDSRPVVAGTAALDRLETQAHQTERAARSMSMQMSTVGNVSNQMRMQVQNAAFQVGDMATQIASGTQASRALAMQLPQLLGGFGLFGAVAGAAVAILAPLAAGFFDSGNAADDFADALGRADDAMSELNGVVRSISGLEDQYAQAVASGNTALAERIAKLIELREKEAEYQALQLPRLIREQEEALRELTSQQEDAALALADAQRAAQDALDGGDRGQFETALNFLNDARVAYEGITNEADLAANRTAQLTLELEIAKDNLEVTAESARTVMQSMQDTATATAQAVLEAAGLNAQASLMSANFGNAAGAAWGIVSALSAAVSEAINLSSVDTPVGQSVILGGVRPSAGDIIGTQDQQAAITRAEMQIDRYQASLRNVASAAGRGGGAATAVEELASVSDTLTDILRDAEDPVQDMQDELQSFADGIDGIAQGAVDSFVDQLVNGFEDGMDGLKSLLESTIKEMAAYLIKNQLQVSIGANVAGSAASGLGGVGSLAAMGPVGIGAAAFAVGYMIGDAIFGGNDPEPYAGSEQEAIDQEKAALIQQMHVLEGHSNYLKKQEIEAYDESNQALARKVQLLEEEAAIEAERQSLQMQLWELEGNTEAIRAAQLEQLDESNRALQEQIWAQQDLAAATDETTRAIEEAIAAISPDDYSTQFAYDRAIALAKNGYIPPDGTTPATSANPQQAQVEQTAAMNSQLSTLTSLMRESLTIMRQWNANGLPPEAV